MKAIQEEGAGPPSLPRRSLTQTEATVLVSEAEASMSARSCSTKGPLVDKKSQALPPRPMRAGVIPTSEPPLAFLCARHSPQM